MVHVLMSDKYIYPVQTYRFGLFYGSSLKHRLTIVKYFVGFKVEGNTFCDVVFFGRSLKIYLNLKSGELEDSKGIARDVSNVGHWGNGAYEIKISASDEIEYILSLVKQSFMMNKK